MPTFNDESLENLSQCDEELQKLFKDVIKDFDCSVLCGHRTEEDQNEAFRANRSKFKYPDSKHNKNPSRAVDVVPYPIDWENLKRFYYFGGFVKGRAKELGIKVRWGGDWDGDTLTDDQKFMDLPHFELGKSYD